MKARIGLVVAIALAAGAGAPTATAAPRGGDVEESGGGGKGGGGKKADNAIEVTGIPLFDDVFTKVGPIDRTLSGVEGSLRSAKLHLTDALALEEGTPLRDAIAELHTRAGNKISLAQKGKVPTLSAADGVPSNVQSAVDAVNGLTRDLTSSMDDLAALPKQITALINETKAFPSQLRAEFSKGSSGLLATLFKLPKASSALTHDLGVVTGLPDRTNRVTQRSTEILGVVTSTFGSRR
jgi:hypothetical protein